MMQQSAAKELKFDPHALANEELMHVYRDRHNALLVTVFTGAVVAVLLALGWSWKAALAWYVWLLLAYACHWIVGKPNRLTGIAMPLSGLRHHIVASGVAGAGWGGAVIALPHLHETNQAALLMMMVIAVNTALPRLVLYVPLFVAFVAGVFIPLLLILPFLDTSAQKLVAVMLAVVLVTLWLSARDVRAVLVRILLKQIVFEHVSWQDRLTGLGNRRRFDDTLESSWRQAARLGVPLSLIILDVDHFKKFNDTYGHLAGDECLRKVATALAGSVRRGGDTVARYGGEEFAIVLFHTPMTDARNLGVRMCEAVKGIGLKHEQSPYGVVTISIGGATVLPSTAMTPQELIEHADAALYKAKENGRNRVEWNMVA